MGSPLTGVFPCSVGDSFAPDAGVSDGVPLGALGHDPCDAFTESLAQLKSCLARVNGDVFTELV